MTPKAPRIHYGWHIVWSGTLGIFACLGLGRFALGMLLPAMGESLGLSYTQMGLISTSNFTGYLLSVLGCSLLTARIGHRLVIFLALILIGGSMVLIGRAELFISIVLLYFLTGIGSGAANVPIMALVSGWFTKKKRGRATGFAVIGSGFAILLAGKLIPILNQQGGADGWRLGWITLGIIVLAAALVCFLVQRNSPKEMGLEPYGREGGDTTGPLPDIDRRIDQKTVLHLCAIYFLFGATYVVYVTFFVTSLVRDRGFSEMSAGNFWAWVGALSLMSGPIFGSMSDRFGRKVALVTVFSIQATAYLLAGLQQVPELFLYASIGCFGITAWAIPSIIAAMVGDLAGPQKAARVFGFVTFIFSLGQISAPAVAGILAEQSGSFSSSFLATAGLAALGAVLAGFLTQKPLKCEG
ncbi:MAG: YbfB/YjiJ family MFS transporter [Proteobacteria bacterium]|nr:YbfB/YjiJ family MFS transporter [Pseudomonadota bacterium]